MRYLHAHIVDNSLILRPASDEVSKGLNICIERVKPRFKPVAMKNPPSDSHKYALRIFSTPSADTPKAFARHLFTAI